MAFNDDLFDLTISHQIGIRRLENREIKSLVNFYTNQRREINSRLYSRWGMGRNASVTKMRMREIRTDLNKKINILTSRVQKKVNKSSTDLARYEMTFQKDLYTRVAKQNIKAGTAQLNFNFNVAPIDTVLTSIYNTPFDGDLPNNWFKSLNRSQKTHLSRALQSSVLQGEGLGGLQRRVKSITDLGTRQTAALSRTMLMHAQNRAKEKFAQENKIRKRRYTAVLDHRTTWICASLDGRVYTDNENYPGIPQHMGCRSTWTFFFEPSDLANERITITDNKSKREIEKYLRQQARANGTSVALERRSWAKQYVGRISGKTTFQEFFSKQRASFQRSYLGESRYRLYKKGGLKIQDMVNTVTGKRLNLNQLRQFDSNAFNLAGL